jgi:aldehyde dehydrogenase (NAD+)
MALGPWNAIPRTTRGEIIHQFANNLAAHKDEIIAIECNDQGKPIFQATKDLDFSVKIIKNYAARCDKIEGIATQRDSGNQAGSFMYTRKEPIGVVGMITPWNFPMLMTSFKMGPFLASGCTGIFKSPELAPLSSLKFAEIWENTEGTIPGVVNMLPGIGSEVGDDIVDHPDIKMIAFTGSTAVGKRILSRASANVKRTQMELGGKSPLIVFPDADIGKAAFLTTLFGTISSGQFCGAPSRVFVHEDCHD